jgi:hypothetical protein
MTIQNDYQKANHQTIQTSSNTPKYNMGDKIAQTMAEMRIKEATMKYERAKVMFRKYQQDNTLSRENIFDAKMAYMKANPIFKMPKENLKPEKPTFSNEYIQTHLGRIATGDFPKDIAEENIPDRAKALKTAERFFNTDPNHLMPEVSQEINNNYPKEEEQPQGSGDAIKQISSLLENIYAFPYKVNEMAGKAIYKGIKGRQGQTSKKISTPKTQQEYDALPSGTEYIEPETGQHKRKK